MLLLLLSLVFSVVVVVIDVGFEVVFADLLWWFIVGFYILYVTMCVSWGVVV